MNKQHNEPARIENRQNLKQSKYLKLKLECWIIKFLAMLKIPTTCTDLRFYMSDLKKLELMCEALTFTTNAFTQKL